MDRLVRARERDDVQEDTRTATDIAKAVVAALRANPVVPEEAVSAAVSSRRVTLNGEVEWNYQRVAAAAVVRDLVGVPGVTNAIAVKARVGTVVNVRSNSEDRDRHDEIHDHPGILLWRGQERVWTPTSAPPVEDTGSRRIRSLRWRSGSACS